MTEGSDTDAEFRQIIRRMLGEEPEAPTRPTGRAMVDEFSAATRQYQHHAGHYLDRALAGDPEALRQMARVERELNQAAASARPDMMARWPWPGLSRPTALFM